MRTQKTFNIEIKVLALLEEFCEKNDCDPNTAISMLIQHGIIRYNEVNGKNE